MKIVLVDDHWVCCKTLKRLLAQLDKNIECLEVDSFGEARKLIDRNPKVRMVVLDLPLPDMTALDGLRALRSRVPQVAIVIHSMIETCHEILRAVEQRVAGFIPKTSSQEEVVEALEQIFAGELYLPRVVLGENGRQKPRQGSFAPLDAASRRTIAKLTDRQRQVLGYLAQGIMTDKEISEKLGLSENTVRIHVSGILRTLGLDNRTEAALLAAQYLSQDSSP